MDEIMKKQPGIFETVIQFDSKKACLAHLENIRRPNGLKC